MSRGTSLSCQSTRVCLVIRKNKVISLDKIKTYCETYCSKYAFIEHLQDIDCSSGEIIPPHYHIVCIYKDNKIAFSTRLNTICDFFNFDNPIGIEIDKMISLESSIQYLIHKNNKEKTQHSRDEIIHNFIDSELDILLNSENGYLLTYDTLLKAVMSASKKSDIIKEIGLGYFSHYWRAINWLWEDYRCTNPFHKRNDSEIDK